jgi:hypothetical protein
MAGCVGGWRRIGLCGRLEEDWVVWEAGGGLGCVGGWRRIGMCGRREEDAGCVGGWRRIGLNIEYVLSIPFVLFSLSP